MKARDLLLDRGFVVFDSRTAAEPLLKILGRESPREVLEPKAAASGGAWSHSDWYGFGAFPWHTDGAVAALPPRWMVLECEAIEGTTATQLLKPTSEVIQRFRRCAMKVRERAGRVRHLPAASPIGGGGVRLRWDPRVCETNDPLLEEMLRDAAPTAVCEWTAKRILVVDNWRVLHRRPEVEPMRERRLVRTYVRTT